MKWIQKLFVVLFVVLASSAVMAYDFTDAVDSNNDGVGIAPYPVTGEEKINAILDFEVEDPIYVWEKNGAEQDEYVGSVIPASELVDGDEWEVTVSYLEYVGGYVGYIEVELGSEAVEVEESEETDDTNHVPKATDIYFTVTEGDLVNVDMIQDEDYWTYSTHQLRTQLRESETVYTYDADADYLMISYDSLIGPLGMWQTGNDDAGVYNVVATVTDGIDSTEATITITVEDNGVIEDENTAPLATDIYFTVTEGDLVNVDMVQDGDYWTYSTHQLRTQLRESETVYTYDADDDSLKINYDSLLNALGMWQTGNDDAGVYNVVATVSDGKAFTTATITITVEDNGVVEDENTCPVITANDIVVNEGELAVASYIATDADGDELFISFSEPYDSNGEWQTAVGDEGVYSSIIAVSDGECIQVEWFMTTVNEVVVDDENTAPVIEDVTDVEVDEGETVNVCPVATDADGDVLTYTYEGTPGGSYDANGCWTWNTDYNDAGEYDVDVCVSDGELSDCTSFEVEVNDVCDDENENGICDDEEYVKSNFEGGLLKVQYVTVLNAKDLSNGNDDEIKVYVEMQNDNSYDAENIKVTLIFEGKDYVYNFEDLDRSELGSVVYTVEVPESLETGRYPLIVKINNEDINYETAFNLNFESEVSSKTVENLTFWEQIVSFFRNLF